MECGGCLKQPPYSKSGVWRSLSGVWRLLETTSTLHSTPHDLGHKWSVEVTQIETKNEWSVEVFECFSRFRATVCHPPGNQRVIQGVLEECRCWGQFEPHYLKNHIK